MEQVKVHYSEVKEQEGDNQRCNTSEGYNLEGYVSLCAKNL